MKAILTHYAGDWTWIKDFTDEYRIYNRSEEEIPNSIKRANVGDADYDRLSYIVDNYYDLPEVFLLSKSNLFKYITPEEWDEVKNNTDFTPLLTKNHKTYSDAAGEVCFYKDGIYWERNNSWYLGSVPAKYFKTYGEFAKTFNLPDPPYLPFAPGGNYILTRERVHRYAVDFYKDLASLLPYCQRPGEAQFLERTYYTLWS